MNQDVKDSRLHAAQTRALKRELARLRQERRDRRDDRGRLDRVLELHHLRHMAMARMSSAEARRFQRLHERLADTVGAQAEFVGRVSRAVGPRWAG